MSCGYSKETLALYVENDLPSAVETRKLEAHIETCAACREYCNGLRISQSFIRSRLRPMESESVSHDMLRGIRFSVMSQIETAKQSLSWSARLERLFFASLRTPRYAALGIAIVAIVSASLLGQMRYGTRNVLAAPSDYRQWVLVGNSTGHEHGPGNIYMNPVAYREYEKSGTFPQGTVIVFEHSERLQMSMKDSNRFEDGWGFYDFAGSQVRSEPLPQTAGCVSCHRQNAATDHVFTQYYSALKL